MIDAQTQARVALALRAPGGAPPRHVVIYQSTNSAPDLKVTSGAGVLNLVGPWIREAALLNEQGIAVAYVDAPSDANGRGPSARAPREVRQDLQAVVKHLAKQYAGVPIHAAGFSASAVPVLESAAGIDGLDKVVVVSGNFLNAREESWPSLKSRVLIIHAPSGQCDSAPFHEARDAARRNQFVWIPVGYAEHEREPNCGRGSQHVLAGRGREFAQAVGAWLDGRPLSAEVGAPDAQPAWREQVLSYTAPALIGSNQLEMTLYLPQGQGPFPVLVHNHGDMTTGVSHLKYRQRVRDIALAREFLKLGIAVAVPARRGVAMSQGTYPINFHRHDADPTYKARTHAIDILPAIEYLKILPEIDGKRVLVSGQSAGGYSAMHIASLNLPQVLGVIDFAGGRSENAEGTTPIFLNPTMVNGFAELGKVTKIPTLWVFAENDSRYSANTIRASHEAFIKAGGKAKLFLNPPLAGDGHFLISFPDLWRSILREYLSEIGVWKGEGK